MSRTQIARLAVMSLVVAAVQTAGLDRVLVFGFIYLALPLYLAVAVGARLPFTNAALAGSLVGIAWDLLGVSLFGRYALALAVVAGVASVLLSGTADLSRRTRLARRSVAVALGVVIVVCISAFVGETLPPLTIVTLGSLVGSIAVGTVLSGRVLRRVGLPGRVIWDPEPVRTSDWTDHRAGLYTVVPAPEEREAA